MMHTIIAGLTSVSAGAASSLATSIWQGTVLAVGVALCLRLLPGLSAAARAVVWMAVFGLVAALHVQPWVGASAAGVRAGVALDARWSLAIVAVWAVLSMLRAVQLVHAGVALGRIARGARLVEAPEWCAGHLRRSARWESRAVRLAVSTEIDRPSVAGFFAPRILLPPGLLETLSPEALEQVVLHELEHLRRRDDWTNLLQKAALAVFPLNPVLLWVERRLCTERELACDDGVLRATGARKAYAACLAQLAEQTLVRRGVELALRVIGVGRRSWSARPSELTRRVTRILQRPVAAMSGMQSAAAVSLLVAGLGVGSLAFAHAPQLVSFGPQARGLEAQAGPERTLRPMKLSSSRSLQAQAVLTKAVMPSRAVSQPVEARALRSHAVRVVSRRVRVSPPTGSWVILTSWQTQEGAVQAVQTRYTVARVSQVQSRSQTGDRFDGPVSGRTAKFQQLSYAAVPTPDGWLIVQL